MTASTRCSSPLNKTVRRGLLAAALLLLAFPATAFEAVALRNLQDGDALASLAGLPGLTLEQLKGAPALLVFLRRGQPQSAALARDLAKLRAEYKAGELKIYAVVPLHEAADAAALQQEFGAAVPLLADADYALYGALGVTAMPTAVLLDRQLKLIHAYAGYGPQSLDTLRGELDARLKPGATARAAAAGPAVDPMQAVAADKAQRHLKLARMLEERGRYGDAAKEYGNYLQAAPGDAGARRTLAFVLALDSDFAAAEEQLKLLEEKGAAGAATRFLAALLAGRQGDLAQARALAAQLPPAARAELETGFAVDAQHKYAEAEKHYRQAFAAVSK